MCLDGKIINKIYTFFRRKQMRKMLIETIIIYKKKKGWSEPNVQNIQRTDLFIRIKKTP